MIARLPWRILQADRAQAPAPAEPATVDDDAESANLDEALRFVRGLRKSSIQARDRMRQVAFHESGHAVLYHLHNTGLRGLSLNYQTAEDGSFQPGTIGGYAYPGRGRLCTVCCMAGYAAEREAGYSINMDVIRDSEDWRDALLAVRGERDMAQALDAAGLEIKAHWQTVQDLAEELLRCGRLGAAHAAAVIEGGPVPDPVSYHRASRRRSRA